MADSSIATMPDLPEPPEGAPPEVAAEVVAPPDDESRWPKTIGVLSIIYALGGLLCNVAYGTMTIFTESLMKMQGAELSVPISVKAIGALIAAINLVLGVVLLVGAIKLLRRRRSGVVLIQRWAVLRLVTLLIAALTVFVTAPTQVEIARAQAEAGAQRRPGGAAEFTPPSDESLYHRQLIQTSVLIGLTAIYPLVVGLYLSRKKIHRQTQRWPTK